MLCCPNAALSNSQAKAEFVTFQYAMQVLAFYAAMGGVMGDKLTNMGAK